MNVETDVAVLRQQRLAGMEAHPDAQRPFAKFRRGCDGVARTTERGEERVALCVHLGATVACQGLAHCLPVLRQDIRVVVPEVP